MLKISRDCLYGITSLSLLKNPMDRQTFLSLPCFSEVFRFIPSNPTCIRVGFGDLFSAQTYSSCINPVTPGVKSLEGKKTTKYRLDIRKNFSKSCQALEHAAQSGDRVPGGVHEPW